ncbi:hypothetical protein DMH04_37185 [Kibdelosporangium aridum]|uniref:Transmembrane protein n=1 Tax=Kibdelosporangium aridum TaxID=2030 RepID=A0A428YYX4_KIBAR|nr:hypothetical protein [Kibdelosporangium aridum]RSM75944.1 hypothetical protein DMH04_37185 [Kibdelosporangium aridum]
MAELNMRERWQIRPDTVYMAVVLWWTAAGLTMVPALFGLYETLDRVRWDDVPRLLGGFALGVALVIVAITKFDRGRPVARMALTGLAVYYTWTLIIGLSVIMAGKSQGVIILFLIEVARTLCAIAAAALSYTPTARKYFNAYNAHDTRTDKTLWVGWLWAAGIAALALQFGAEFVDNLPSHGRSWTQWATGRNAISSALTASFLLCLMPAYASIVRQFLFGRQWARVTLTVFGVLCGILAVLQITDTFTVSTVFAAIQVLATAAALVWSCLPAVNAHFLNQSPR